MSKLEIDINKSMNVVHNINSFFGMDVIEILEESVKTPDKKQIIIAHTNEDDAEIHCFGHATQETELNLALGIISKLIKGNDKELAKEVEKLVLKTIFGA